MAHEIKNPLTPIQLTIDRLKSKYSEYLNDDDKEKFKENLKIINNQIKQIEKLINDFSDFARMPKPTLQNNDLILLINDNIKLLQELDNSINITFKTNDKEIFFNSDKEQLSRVFFNLIKNSIESIHQKLEKISNIRKNIAIELINENNHISFIIDDTGIGFDNLNENIKDILNPYFTTKEKGTGLGLSIVNKIINDHNGKIEFFSKDEGAKIKITFLKL
jgi:two-component system nitrogen regulation sensor histidine kinase NtrY